MEDIYLKEKTKAQGQETSSPYIVKLEQFEGPLDLLFFLVRREELNIYDIPLAFIISQYLEYVNSRKALNLEEAGEFILISAILIRIKTQLLLPKSDLTEEEEIVNPEEELAKALEEYKKFKQAAFILEQKGYEQSGFYPRGDFSYLGLPSAPELSSEVGLFDLLAAFKRILDEADKEVFHTVEYPDITIQDRIEYIISYLTQKDRVLFTDLFKDNPIRLVMVVTFLAILELIKLRKIIIRQRKSFSEIWVHRNEH